MVLLALEIPVVLQDQVIQVSQQRLDYQLVRGRREVRLVPVRRRRLVDLADRLCLVSRPSPALHAHPRRQASHHHLRHRLAQDRQLVPASQPRRLVLVDL